MTEAVTAAPARSPGLQGHHVFAVGAWLLLAACLGLVVTGLVVGERPSTYDDLRADVASGDVDTVTVTGGIPGPFRGRETVTVHWRDGLFRQQATVVEQHPQRRTLTRDGIPVVYSVEDDLAGSGTDVEVERRPHDDPRYQEVAGWMLPASTSTVALCLVLVGLVMVIGGPQPQRATRWAWFWILCTAQPVGLLAFLLLSGRLSFRPPVVPGRRLTGGWAFLGCLIVGPVLF